MDPAGSQPFWSEGAFVFVRRRREARRKEGLGGGRKRWRFWLGSAPQPDSPALRPPNGGSVWCFCRRICAVGSRNPLRIGYPRGTLWSALPGTRGSASATSRERGGTRFLTQRGTLQE